MTRATLEVTGRDVEACEQVAERFNRALGHEGLRLFKRTEERELIETAMASDTFMTAIAGDVTMTYDVVTA